MDIVALAGIADLPYGDVAGHRLPCVVFFLENLPDSCAYGIMRVQPPGPTGRGDAILNTTPVLVHAILGPQVPTLRAPTAVHVPKMVFGLFHPCPKVNCHT